MRPLTLLAAGLSVFSIACAAGSNATTPLSSHQILPNNFKPPQVFKNVNLLRNINLEKGYVRETINVVIENVDKKPQVEYYIPFTAEVIGKVGGLEVRDKKDAGKPVFRSEVVEYDPYRYVIISRVEIIAITILNQAAQPNSTESPSLLHSPRLPSKLSR